MKLSINIEIFREGDLYVALAPELNISSFGENVEDAQNSVREALEAFIEECDKMGTLELVLSTLYFSFRDSLYDYSKLFKENSYAD